MNTYSPKIEYIDKNIVISGVDEFELSDTLDCGQAFRFSKIDENNWHGIALNSYIKIGKLNDQIILYNVTLDDYEQKWKHYFDFERNYEEIINIISENEVLKAAAEKYKGIRILNQDPWEAICSFIISQNNNIPRIKGIIERLCENFGDKIDGGYSFPTAQKLSNLTPEDLMPLRAGFRARYIIDAAKKVSSGELDFELIKNGEIDLARAELMKIIGVGTKVADCSLLFGFGRIEALPKDVWIKRAIAEYFDGNFPKCAESYAGIAQQYLFSYIRDINKTTEE